MKEYRFLYLFQKIFRRKLDPIILTSIVQLKLSSSWFQKWIILTGISAITKAGFSTVLPTNKQLVRIRPHFRIYRLAKIFVFVNSSSAFEKFFWKIKAVSCSENDASDDLKIRSRSSVNGELVMSPRDSSEYGAFTSITVDAQKTENFPLIFIGNKKNTTHKNLF